MEGLNTKILICEFKYFPLKPLKCFYIINWKSATQPDFCSLFALFSFSCTAFGLLAGKWPLETKLILFQELCPQNREMAVESWIILNFKKNCNAALKSVWRQCLGAGPRWQRQGIEALIYLSNVQVQCSVFPLAHLDVRTLSLPSNQYGAVPGLISSSSLIRPARMLCWCGQAALGLQQVSAHLCTAQTCQLDGIWEATLHCAGRGQCTRGVCLVLSPCWAPRLGLTEQLVCFVRAGVVSWGSEWSCSNWQDQNIFQGFAFVISK